MTTFTKKNNWWADAYNFAEDRERTGKRKPGVKSRNEFRGFVCSACKKVWETAYVTEERKTKLHKYHDFPTYGLERRICLPCELK